ncbi:MAG: hypothetical protein ACI841_003701 [Planctomycetota bacterium]|jgi:hypothetical protein
MNRTVALIDSGVNASHPHIRDREGVVRSWQVEQGADADLSVREVAAGQDRIGHGTAAAAAILDLAPGLHIESIQVFEDDPTASFERILIALDHALSLQPDVCNLSLGTTRESWSEPLEARVRGFEAAGIPLVAPVFWRGLPCYPGCMPGCVGVRIDPDLQREYPERRDVGGREDWFAAPYPRELPDLPRASNLAGVSMACANVTGFLIRALDSDLPRG